MATTRQWRPVLAAAIVTMALVGWGTGVVHGAEPPRPGGAGGAGMLRFQTLVVKDRLMDNQEAFRLLIPADWRGEGQVDWRFHPQYPAGLRVRAYNPAGVEAVYGYPMIPFVSGVRHLPAGGYYVGNEVRPFPGDVAGYVRHYLLPRFRPDIRGYRVLAVEAMPDWARASPAARDARSVGIPCKVQAGRVRIAYALKGQPVEEEFYVMLDSLFMVGLHYWGTEWATSVRAAPGGLGPVRRIQVTMVSSARLSLAWYNRERQVAAGCAQIIKGEQEAVMKISHIIAQANDEITETIRTTYENRQAVLDRVNERFSEYIRGVQTYRGADGQRLQLPAGYRQAWVNNRGEYLMSDSATFNPNVELREGNWRPLRLER